MTPKPALRAQLRARRDAATRPRIPAWPAFTERLSSAIVVASYTPTRSEVDPAALAAAALAAGARLALPHVVDRATPLRFLLVEEGPLAKGPFGLANPSPHWREAAPAIILTPLLGFDRRGNRLGQGAGHYDRAFATYPDAWRVGIGWSVQEVDALDTDPWDVPLHAIATEREWIVVA